MTKPIVLALDISKNSTGWAVNASDWPRPFWGTYSMPGPWDRHEGKRQLEWRNFLKDIIAQHAVTHVAVERLFIDMKDFNFNGTEPMMKFHGQVECLVAELGLNGYRVAINQWRAHFIGTGVAPKDITKPTDRTTWWKKAALKRCYDRFWMVENDDEAEALGVMDFVLTCVDDDYAHKTGPETRRKEHKAEVAAFRGDSLL